MKKAVILNCVIYKTFEKYIASKLRRFKQIVDFNTVTIADLFFVLTQLITKIIIHTCYE